MRLEHTNLTVTDLERSIDFYQRALGFEVRWQGQIYNTTRMAPAAHVAPPGADFYFSLFEGDAEGRAPYSYAPAGINHFGVVVDDLDEMQKQVEAAGAEIHTAYDYDPGRRIYFFDPDGIEIELVQY
jgi:catechol 2,3-dioxygenase-like lactoylglutathione lyase family enzyme